MLTRVLASPSNSSPNPSPDQEERAKLHRAIDGRSLGPDGGYQALNSLLLSYLVHHGYEATATALARSTGLLPPLDAASDAAAATDSNRMEQDPPAQRFIPSAASDQFQQQLAAIGARQGMQGDGRGG